jgi:hypothetical protein
MNQDWSGIAYELTSRLTLLRDEMRAADKYGCALEDGLRGIVKEFANESSSHPFPVCPISKIAAFNVNRTELNLETWCYSLTFGSRGSKMETHVNVAPGTIIFKFSRTYFKDAEVSRIAAVKFGPNKAALVSSENRLSESARVQQWTNEAEWLTGPIDAHSVVIPEELAEKMVSYLITYDIQADLESMSEAYCSGTES